MSPLIQLVGLTKDYGSFRALSDVNLQILPGCTGLLGPNGAGKSTLIKVLLGLVRTTAGSGHVLGIPLGSQTTSIRSRIGYMPEDDCYIHGLSGIETLQVAARLTGMESTEAIRRGHEILDFCGAGQERYRAVETYSTGMRQKLRFAMAIVHDPELLILDDEAARICAHEAAGERDRQPDRREQRQRRGGIRVDEHEQHGETLACRFHVAQVADDAGEARERRKILSAV